MLAFGGGAGRGSCGVVRQVEASQPRQPEPLVRGDQRQPAARQMVADLRHQPLDVPDLTTLDLAGYAP